MSMPLCNDNLSECHRLSEAGRELYYRLDCTRSNTADEDPANMDKNFTYTRMRNNTPKPLTRSRFSTISIHDGDRIRLINYTDAEIRAIENVIRASWHKPIQATNPLSYAYEIKLTGWPWDCTSTSSDSTPSCVLICDLLAHLFSQGWIHSLPTSISRNPRHGDSLMFRSQPKPPPKSEWLAVKFAKRDHLCVIGAPGDERLKSLIEGIRAPLKDMGYIQHEKAATSTNLQYALYDFKIHGNPRNPTSEERVAVAMLLMKLLETLDRFGWSLYASVGPNIFGHDENYFLGMMMVYKKDTWICVRTVDEKKD